MSILFDGGYTVPAVARAMDAVCQARLDCVSVISVPTNSQSPVKAAAYRNVTLNLSSSYTALYTPDITVLDTYGNQNISMPPSGAVAAQYAYTANNFFPWFAAAGLKRGLIPCLGLAQTYSITQGETAVLHAAQVNPILDFPGSGFAIFDQMTLQGFYSAFSMMNVRILNNIITQTINKYLWGKVFDPNDDRLGAALVSAAQEVLDYVYQNEGLTRPGIAYSNSTNNSNYTMNLGQRILTVVYTPIYPAQQIVLQSVITAQGASYEVAVKSLNGGLV